MKQCERKIKTLAIGLELKDIIFPLIFTITLLGTKGKSSFPFYKRVAQGQPGWQGSSLDHNQVSRFTSITFLTWSLSCGVSSSPSPITFSEKWDFYESEIPHGPFSMGPSLLLALVFAVSITEVEGKMTWEAWWKFHVRLPNKLSWIAPLFPREDGVPGEVKFLTQV